MKKIEMKPGKTIFKAGEPADGLYIVGSGEVGIYFPTNKEMAEPDIILKANEILGEMGLEKFGLNEHLSGKLKLFSKASGKSLKSSIISSEDLK